MSVISWAILFVAALSTAACGAKHTSNGREVDMAGPGQAAQTAAPGPGPQRDTSQQRARAVEALLRVRYGDLGGELRYFDAATDLNGDGQAEIVVYAYGPMLCGTGGCSTLVFTPGASGYRLVSEISVSRPPIQAASRTTNGWRDLLVHVSGGGIVEGYDAELKFDGTSYPDNPTVAPAEPTADKEGAVVLIPEFASFTDGKLVAAP